MSSSPSVSWKDILEWIRLVAEIATSVATVLIAVVGVVLSSRQRKTTEYNNRRALLKEATSRVDMEYAHDVFQDRSFQKKYAMGEGDYHQIFSNQIQFPREAWHRQCRSQLLIFLETIRPVCHLLADQSTVVEGTLDPALFPFRLAMSAMADFWSPSGGLKSPCNDEHRNFIQAKYGDRQEWAILCQALEKVGLEGRLNSPYSDFGHEEDDEIRSWHL